MKKITSILAALGLVSLSVIVPVPAMAQYYGTVTCEAASPYAQGLGINYTPASACQRALAECAIRTPTGFVCTVTRWYWN